MLLTGRQGPAEVGTGLGELGPVRHQLAGALPAGLHGLGAHEGILRLAALGLDGLASGHSGVTGGGGVVGGTGAPEPGEEGTQQDHDAQARGEGRPGGAGTLSLSFLRRLLRSFRDLLEDAVGEALRDRLVLPIREAVMEGGELRQGLPAGGAVRQVGAEGRFLLRGAFPVHEGVQRLPVVLTGRHPRPPFPVSIRLDAGKPERFPLSVRNFRSAPRPRLIRDFTVPSSAPVAAAISS